MKRLFKKTLVSVVVLMCGIKLIGEIYNANTADPIREHYDREQYTKITLQQIKTKWECLPDHPQINEAFALNLMQRFTPQDYAQLINGQDWLKEYAQKQEKGTLTVEERNNLVAHLKPHPSHESSYYTLPWPPSKGESMVFTSHNLRIEECVKNSVASCPEDVNASTYGDDFSITYRKKGLIWSAQKWGDLIKTEYQNSEDAEHKLADALRWKEENARLLNETQEYVSQLPANVVPPQAEQERVHIEYLKRRCL